MSLKLFKPSESNLGSPESPARPQQKRIKNRWGFNLHESVPIGELRNESEEVVQIRKNLMRKFYGKKILYVTKFQEVNAVLSRSKLLQSVEVDQAATIQNNLKSKGNFVIFSYSSESSSADADLEYKKPLLFQKIFRSCQKAEIPILYAHDLKMFKYLLAVRHIFIVMDREFELGSIGRIVGNFLKLETLKIRMRSYGGKDNLPKKAKHLFFASLSRLSYLQKVKLNMDDLLLESAEMKLEIDRFYSRPISFGFSLTLRGLKIEEGTNLAKFLSGAEHLSLIDSEDPRTYYYDPLVSMAKKEKRIMKAGNKKNIVRICKSKGMINIAEILQYCDSLKSLYICDRDRSIQWKEIGSQKEMKALQNLETAVLEFQFLGMIPMRIPWEDPEGEAENNSHASGVEENEKNPHPQLAILSQISEKCSSLQRFALYATNLEFRHNYSARSGEQIESARENFSKFIQEVSALDNLKVFGLQMDQNELRILDIGNLLSNKNLESFELQFSPQSYQSSYLDSLFFNTRGSEIKELRITIPKEVKEMTVFGTYLLDSIKVFNNLQIVELIDTNLDTIRLNLLYEIVQSLLEKKDIRKIVFCTKVHKRYDSYIERDRETVSTNDSVFQELQGQVNILKDRQLEEIFVGKLYDYSFAYMLYNKELAVTEKLLWTQEEMDQLSSENKELKRRYAKKFELFTEIEAEFD